MKVKKSTAKIEQWQQQVVPLSSLKPYEKNPRTHSKQALDRLVDKIQRFGYHGRIIATPDMRVIGGHLRLKALAALGIDPVAVLVAPRPLSEAEYRELLITDNLQDGEWNISELTANFSLEELTSWNMPPEILSAFEVTPVEGLTDPDEVPEPPAAPVSAQGDVWRLGAHRVMCGDSTSVDDVTRLMDGHKADMVFTDPPYGVNIVNTKSKKVGGGGKTHFKQDTASTDGGKIVDAKQYAAIIGDDTTETAKEFYQTCLAMGFDNFIIFGGNYFTDFLPPSPCWLIWDKQNTGNFALVEIAWCSSPKGAKLYSHLWNGLARAGDRKTELSTRVHPTQKPVGLFEQIFNDFKFEYCFDGFLGSGSTLIACEKTGRACYGMELSPAYCDVIVKR